MEIPGRLDMERRFARQLSRMAARHRRLVRDHLGDPPDVRNVPVAVWSQIQTEMEAEASAALLLLFMASGVSQARAVTGTDLSNATLQNVGAQGRNWARSYSRPLAQGYSTNAQALLNRTERPADGVVPSGVWLVRVHQALGDAVVDSVAASATTDAQSAGGEATIRTLGLLSAEDHWVTERDRKVCKVCASLHMAARPVWSRMFPDGPKAHPNCRCFIRYAAEAQRVRA